MRFTLEKKNLQRQERRGFTADVNLDQRNVICILSRGLPILEQEMSAIALAKVKAAENYNTMYKYCAVA